MAVADKKPPSKGSTSSSSGTAGVSTSGPKRKKTSAASTNAQSSASTPINIGELSIDILQDLIRSLTHEVAARAVHLEHRIRSQYGREFVARPYATALPPGIRAKSAQKTEVVGRVAYLSSPWSSHAGTPVNGSTPGTPKVANGHNAGTDGGNNNATTSTVAPSPATPSASLLEDMYGIEKSTEPRYFECLNCTRKIAGSRFAAHLERCLGGRNSRHKDRKAAVAYGGPHLASENLAPISNNNNNSYNSPSPSSVTGGDFSSTSSSPAKSQLGEHLSGAGAGTSLKTPPSSSAGAAANSSQGNGSTESSAPPRTKKRKIGLGGGNGNSNGSNNGTSNGHSNISSSGGPTKTALSKFFDRGVGGTGSSGTMSNGNSRDSKNSIHSAPSSPRGAGGSSSDKNRSHSEEPSIHPRKRAKNS
ncbi:uncharacterized protein SAPINGB_P005261 [Magnusiomyces paraingens]|uniref:SAGA-associated factor 11 n=1 Tax=Magnusiomyces paraingens TaxID=2606893 RepID=A0A5E8BZA2_9ASCO|nr:uncharacterized protein SAPINGB_P005261 [Saprochaete ingens]VVT56774.1 unnamed protein product [Saprochaete ingens]